MSAYPLDSQRGRRDAAEELLRVLLPRFYWSDDATRGGGVLEALVSAIAGQYAELAADVGRMYDDLFIETCDANLVPYIGDGIGVTGLAPVEGPGVSDRAWVGRVIELRRDKGTLAAVARACSAATGWACFAQDAREIVGRTQSVLDPQPDQGRMADLYGSPARGAAEPWSRAARTVRVGGYPAPLAVGVTLWRLQTYPVARRTPRRLAAPEREGRAFTFHPAGVDTPLFEPPGRPPAALTINALRAWLARGGPAHRLPVVVWRPDDRGRMAPIPAERLAAADLSGWRPPSATRAEAVVDPRLGRLVFTQARPAAVEVSYSYGSPGELGGGPYGSQSSYAAPHEGVTVLLVARGESGEAEGVRRFDSLTGALAAAAEEVGDCVVLIDDSATYGSDAAHLRAAVRPGRVLRIASSPEAAPTVAGDLRAEIAAGGRVELSGLTIDGTLTVRGAGELAVEHCTLAPLHDHGLVAAADGPLGISVTFSILGPVMTGPRVWLSVADSIVDAGGGDAIGSESEPVESAALDRVTILGSTTARTLVAEDCIFTARVAATEPDTGLVQTSFVPRGSRPPTLIGCPRDSRDERSRRPPLRPRFTSTRWGDPGYGQLSLDCPPEIGAGGSHGGEMGAFNWLREPARFARLPVVLDEMLPAGVTADVEYGAESRSMEAS